MTRGAPAQADPMPGRPAATRAVVIDPTDPAWIDALEERLGRVIEGAVTAEMAEVLGRPEQATRIVADGLKLFVREMTTQDKEALREFLAAVFAHMSDGASKWVGGKFLAAVAGALVTLAFWLVARKW